MHVGYREAYDVTVVYSLKKEAALWSGGSAADTSVSVARQQQGEQAVTAVGVAFSQIFSRCSEQF